MLKHYISLSETDSFRLHRIDLQDILSTNYTKKHVVHTEAKQSFAPHAIRKVRQSKHADEATNCKKRSKNCFFFSKSKENRETKPRIRK